jgi:hypothetical protein
MESEDIQKSDEINLCNRGLTATIAVFQQLQYSVTTCKALSQCSPSCPVFHFNVHCKLRSIIIIISGMLVIWLLFSAASTRCFTQPFHSLNRQTSGHRNLARQALSPLKDKIPRNQKWLLRSWKWSTPWKTRGLFSNQNILTPVPSLEMYFI